MSVNESGEALLGRHVAAFIDGLAGAAVRAAPRLGVEDPFTALVTVSWDEPTLVMAGEDYRRAARGRIAPWEIVNRLREPSISLPAAAARAEGAR